MSSHPWLAPSATLVDKVARSRATAALRGLPGVPKQRLGAYANLWPTLLSTLAGLLRNDNQRVLAAVARVDVLAILLELATNRVEAESLERALTTLWLGLAGHPGLTSTLLLPGPFRIRVVDPNVPRTLALGDVRALAATAGGAVVVGRDGRQSLDAFVVATLPATGGITIVDAQLDPPDDAVGARVQAALTAVSAALPGGRLERVTLGTGVAAFGEARIAADAEAADLVASAHAAFVRTAAQIEPLATSGATRVDDGRRFSASDLLARASGAVAALPWRTDPASATATLAEDLEEWDLIAEPTPAGTSLANAIRVHLTAPPPPRRRALLVNIDADDFVYSFQFGRSVERRCVERGLQLDRIAVNPTACGDIVAELGHPLPAPIADGTEFLLPAEQSPVLADVLRRLSARRYEVVVANVRPPVFHDLLAGGFLSSPTLLWDRHLHGGLREEGDRRGISPATLQALPMRAWSLANKTEDGLQPSLADAGVPRGCGHVWPLDLQFCRSNVSPQPDLLFAGGDNGRDWPVFAQAIRDLPFPVHLITRQPPEGLPSHARVERRVTLCGFRDAMAAAAVTVIPLLPRAAAGVTVIPMAMALGVAIVATQSNWTEQYVRDGEEALLVPAGDAAALRAAISRLFTDTDLRARLIANARRRVAEICDLDGFTREMFATLE